MSGTRFADSRGLWRTTSWWTHTPLSDFDPLLSFAGKDIGESNWKDELWQVMDRERVCTLVHKTKEGTTRRVRIGQADVRAHVAEEIGLGWIFPTDQEESVMKKIQDAIIEESPELPKIFGQESTFELTKKLRVKVRTILDNFLDKLNAFQQSGNGVAASIGPINITLPWHVTHFKECEEIRQCIQEEFETPGERKAIINSDGFLFFDDDGDDAAKTVAWTIHGLVSVVLEHERVALKKCPCPRQEYFLHATEKVKKYFSDRCRFDHYNKELRPAKSASL